MFRSIFLTSLAVPLVSAVPQFPVPKGDGTSGSGKYPAGYSVETSLQGYTIYQPKSPPAGEKLPVILWGNGMCSDQGLGFRNFLTEVASHGYFIIANGRPEGTGQSADTKMPAALEWVSKNAGSGSFAHIDKTKVAAAGQSCGGLQAYKTSTDKRISLTGMFDSGNLGGGFKLSSLHAPVGYFLGGSSDIAYSTVSRAPLLRPIRQFELSINSSSIGFERLRAADKHTRDPGEQPKRWPYANLHGQAGWIGRASRHCLLRLVLEKLNRRKGVFVGQVITHC
jgi:hypothetical protein